MSTSVVVISLYQMRRTTTKIKFYKMKSVTVTVILRFSEVGVGVYTTEVLIIVVLTPMHAGFWAKSGGWAFTRSWADTRLSTLQ